MTARRVEYGVLGPLQITVDGCPAVLRSRRERIALALLLTDVNRVVPTDRLLRALWGDAPPETAVGQVQTLVWRLRRRLGDATIRTSAGGYALIAAGDAVDAVRFADLAARGSELMRSGQVAAAAGDLAAALGLWRGEPFADLPPVGDGTGSGFDAAVAALTERRLVVEAAHADAVLALGRPAELVPDLHRIVDREPLREELRERLMLALYRTGRRTEALATYRRGRELLVAEQGLEPGPGLQRLHARVLAADPTLDRDDDAGDAGDAGDAPRWSVSEVPRDATDFVAHENLAGELAALLTGGPSARPAVPPVVVVSGAAGSGKTALAVHVAHRVARSFPDGQLFVDLHGVDAPDDPATVLARFLRSLGVDRQAVPADPDGRARLFRTRTAGRRMLVVLDNAADEVQVRPLLPAEAGCAVLVTGRRRFGALPGAHPVDLGVFTPEQALDLMGRVIGPERVAAERDACLRVAARCGHLPLAIRIAGARLANRPQWPVARLADRLDDERARLDVLVTGDLAVRSSLALSYDALPGPERRLLRLLGTIDARILPSWAAAALLDLPVDVAEEVIERLAESRLVDVEAPLRYRLHDLVRAFARERSACEDTEAERSAALARLCSGWLTLAEAAYERLPGGFRRTTVADVPRSPYVGRAERDGPAPDPVGWCEDERAALVATVCQAARDAVRLAAGAGAADPGPAADVDAVRSGSVAAGGRPTPWHDAGEPARRAASYAWSLTATLARFLEAREHLDDWRVTSIAALRACVAVGDRRGEAYAWRGLGELELDLDRYDEALDAFGAGLPILERLDDRPGQGALLRAAGTAYRLQGRHAEAMTALGRSLAICVELNDRAGRAQVLHNIGAVHRSAGRPTAAEAAYGGALRLFEELGDRFGESFTRCSLGIVTGATVDRVAEAERHLLRSVALSTELGYLRGVGIALGHLGDLHRRAGQPDRAVEELCRAVAYCREVGDGRSEATELRRLAWAYLALGRPAAARAASRQASDADADPASASEVAELIAACDAAAGVGPDRGLPGGRAADPDPGSPARPALGPEPRRTG